MVRLSLRLLGALQITLDGTPVTGFESAKERVLLAYLAEESRQPHRREKLAGLLWPERTEAAARNNLRRVLSNLRRLLGDRDRPGPPFLLVTAQTVRLNPACDAWVDSLAFARLLRPLRQQPTTQLEEAIRLYQGDFLEGFSVADSPACEEWMVLCRERYQRLMMEALHRLVEEYERRGNFERALELAWKQLDLEPWWEEAHQQLIRLLALSGRRSEALAQYLKCRHVLAEELDAEPSPETTGLYKQIRDQTLAVSLPSPQRWPGPLHNLPLTSGPFVGREAELTTIQDYLQDPACHLLTLVGAGGMGKTRLALETVRDWMSRLQLNELEGATLVSLTPVQTAEALTPAIAQAAGFPLSPGHEPEQQLLEALRHKRWLLILDSFEHLPEGVGLVAEILRTAPHVKIMVTSRARLNLHGEYCLPIAGIRFPEQIPEDPQQARRFAAVNLFLEAAHQVRPGFQPADVDLAEISYICRLVQGMPLGILLAAAWLGVLGPAEIAAEIKKGLDFLKFDWPDVPEGQRSIRAVFDRSWNLLTEREQGVFRSLSVFSGGFTRAAAEQVSGVSLQELRLLADKSLLRITPSGRYEIHELLRQYAAEKLRSLPDAAADVRDRHCAYYTGALHRWEADLTEARQQLALVEMEADRENIHAAWQWAVDHGQVERLASSVGGLTLFYRLLGRYKEGEAALRAVTRTKANSAIGLLTPTSDNLRLRIIAMVERSNYCRKLGRKDQVARLHQQALALLESSEMEGLDTRSERARLLQSMGHFVLMSDYEQGRQLQERALVLFRELDEQWWMAEVLHDLGRAALFTCSVAEARGRFEESLALFQGLGIPLGIAQSMAGLSMVAVHEGRLAEAKLHARRAVSCFREHCAPADLTYGLDILGNALEAAGEFDNALSSQEECLAIHLDLGQRHYSAYPRAALSRVNLHLGRYAEARTHAEIGLDIARETGLRFAEGDAHFVLGGLALIQGIHADAHAHLSEGASIYAQIGEQDSLSRSHALLACTARGSRPPGSVREHLVESLKQAVASRSFLSFLWALPAIELYLLDEGQAERVVELYALASRYPFVSNSCWFEGAVGRQIAEVAATLPAERVAIAEKRGQARDLGATVAELLAELGR